MHKIFYASGFILHLPSQKILLQQYHSSTSVSYPWLLFESESLENDKLENVFRVALLKTLGVTVDTIYKIYSYSKEDNKKNYSLMYTKIDNLEEFPSKNDYYFRWFSFKEVLRIHATEQTKHDIVVGQRVIEAARRKEQGEHTF